MIVTKPPVINRLSDAQPLLRNKDSLIKLNRVPLLPATNNSQPLAIKLPGASEVTPPKASSPASRLLAYNNNSSGLFQSSKKNIQKTTRQQSKPDSHNTLNLRELQNTNFNSVEPWQNNDSQLIKLQQFMLTRKDSNKLNHPGINARKALSIPSLATTKRQIVEKAFFKNKSKLFEAPRKYASTMVSPHVKLGTRHESSTLVPITTARRTQASPRQQHKTTLPPTTKISNKSEPFCFPKQRPGKSHDKCRETSHSFERSLSRKSLRQGKYLSGFVYNNAVKLSHQTISLSRVPTQLQEGSSRVVLRSGRILQSKYPKTSDADTKLNILRRRMYSSGTSKTDNQNIKSTTFKLKRLAEGLKSDRSTLNLLLKNKIANHK